MAKVVQRLIRGYVPAACNIYSRLRLYKCFLESRICQRKFILKWLHHKGQTKKRNKQTNKPRIIEILDSLWDWVGKEFEFVTTWPPMLVCLWLQLLFFFSQKLNVHSELYQQYIAANYVKYFVVSNIIVIEVWWYTVSLVSEYYIWKQPLRHFVSYTVM